MAGRVQWEAQVDSNVAKLLGETKELRNELESISKKDIKLDIDSKSLNSIIDLFGKMESHLKDLKKVFVDVGDGAEFSPLLKTINNIQSSIDKLSTSVKNIGFNMNIDFGSDTEMEAKIQSKISNALQAYQRLFDHIKMTGVGGSMINTNFFEFDINQYDNTMAKLQAYRKFIENMRNEAKAQFNGEDVLFQGTDKSYWTSASAAMGQVTKAFNEMNASADTSPLENLFGGKTNLTEVVSQLGLIVTKLEEISSIASKMAKVDVPTTPIKDTFQGDKIEQATTSAKELDKTLEAVEIPKESFDEVISKFNIIEEKAKNIVKITKDMHRDSDGKPIESYNVTYKDGSNESYGESSNPQLLRSKDVLYDAKESEKKAQAEQKVAEAMAKGREQSEKARQSEQKRQELAQNKAINKALEQEYQERQKVAEASRKQAELDKQNALAFTKSASERLSSAISKYSYGDASDATAMMKQMNRGLSNFGDLSNIQGNIEKLSSSVDKIISDLQLSHEQSLSALKQEIKEEEVLQSQKDAFHKKNLNAIDMEIKKREEESSAYAKTLKSQMEERYNAISSMEKSLDNYNSKLEKFSVKPADGNRYPVYQQQIDNLTKKIGELDTLKNNLSKKDIIDESDMKSVNTLQREIDELILKMNNMSASEKGFDPLGADKALEKIHNELQKNSGMSKEAKRQIQSYYDEIRSGNPSKPIKDLLDDMYKLIQLEREAGRAHKSFNDIFKEKVVYGAAANLAGMIGIYDVINVGRQAVDIVIDLNTQITELAKVSEATSSQIYDDFNSYAEIAKDVGGTISDTISATADWSRNGYNIPDSKELAEVAMIYKNVGDGIDIDQANEYLISTLRGFNLEAKDAMSIIDSMNEVANNEPISASGIGEALQRSAAAFNAANTSLQESIALVTSTNSVLQSPEKVGSMWTTVSARIRGAKTELEEAGLETDGMVESTSKLQALIKGMTGFDILEADGKTFKSIYDIIVGIGDKFQSLSDLDQAALLEALAGKRQSNALAATLNNIDLLKKSYQEATNAEGSAMEEQRKYQESVQYSIDRTKASLEELANDFLSSDFLKGLIDSGDKLINILDWIIDKFGVLGTAGLGAGLFASFKGAGRVKIAYPHLYTYACRNKTLYA